MFCHVDSSTEKKISDNGMEFHLNYTDVDILLLLTQSNWLSKVIIQIQFIQLNEKNEQVATAYLQRIEMDGKTLIDLYSA